MAGPSAVQLSLLQLQQILHMSHYTAYIRYMLHKVSHISHVLHILHILQIPHFTAYMHCRSHIFVMLHIYYEEILHVQWVVAAILRLQVTEHP